jgi:hypothetical protein
MPGAPDSADLRKGRPDWSREWGAAKTGGPNHRRHEVRSGLIRASLQANWNYAKETHQLDAFFDMANRVLKEKTFPVTNERDADLVIDRLYTRLHNNHMNIFYGRGSYNQMLGTLAHGLERFEADFLVCLARATDTTELEAHTLDWLQNVLSYALCEYMDFTPAQGKAVEGAVKMSLSTDPVSLDSARLRHGLEAINLFDPQCRNEGPMDFRSHRERQSALIEVGEVLVARVRDIFDEAAALGSPTELNVTRQALRDTAYAFLDSSDTDLSESSDSALRKLQNRRAIEVTYQLSDLVERPDLEKFEQTANLFLSLEQEGGELLGIGPDYRKWFSQDAAREKLFEAITSDEMVPTVESARFNPRQWDPLIRNNFKASKHTQRVQIVPSTLVRQVGYAVSNYAFGTDQQEQLMRAYERLLDQPEGSIQDIDSLQRAHAKVIHKVHNNPTNIYIGSRAEQVARENISFALETNMPGLKQALADSDSPESLRDHVEKWRSNVLATALQGYLSLTPLEERGVKATVKQAFEVADDSRFKSIIDSGLKAHLELYSDTVRLRGPLARYDVHQLDALRAKGTQVVKLSEPLNASVSAVIGEEGLSLEEKKICISKIVDQIEHDVTHSPSKAPDPDVRAAQNSLLKFVDPLLRLRKEKAHTQNTDVIDRYEHTLSALLASADVAKSWGIADWGKGAGSRQFTQSARPRNLH